MATRSLIGIQRAEPQEIEAIYCHWDGYPAGVGKVLKEHYTSLEKIEALIALGSISSLGPHLESTIAWLPWLGEESQPSRKHADMRDLMASARVDHVYVWSVHDERWHHYAVR